MPYVEARGAQIFYTQCGRQGKPLILIHGAGGSHLHWPSPLRRLPGAQVYAIDLPGHGRSSGPGRTAIEEYAADVVGFLDGVGLAQAILVGHSMGGAIAQTVALRYPERVAGLVLVGTGARLRVSPLLLEGILQNFQGVLSLMDDWAWGPGTSPELVKRGRQMLARVDPQVLWGDFAACDRFDVRDQVGRISVPTLIVTGSEDRMTPPRFAQWLQEHIPHARLVLVEGAGHMVMLEKPEEVAAQIRDWLQAL